MDPKTLVLQYLDEAHSTETALVTNLTAHIAMTTDKPYKRVLERHLGETKTQVENLDRRRAALGAEDERGLVAGIVGRARDAAGQALVLSKGQIDAMRSLNPQERMLKNARDEAATEAIEIAVYDALETVANAAGDKETAKLAADHRKQEERMLSDLRKHIARLAVKVYEDRTGQKAQGKEAAAATRRATSSRSGSRARSGSSRSTASRSGSSRSKTGSSSKS
jgi:ferritin-like metal-binding protein YciE